ncbi:MAG TPA: hypothetical protein DDX05_09045 [Deltaproteobacteria bacterium]|nr:hypothetical protein [Deltaproteobacteria bacterium]HBG73741.1 hypothetical protein [Deltaproteobacteria bacterium]
MGCSTSNRHQREERHNEETGCSDIAGVSVRDRNVRDGGRPGTRSRSGERSERERHRPGGGRRGERRRHRRRREGQPERE